MTCLDGLYWRWRNRRDVLPHPVTVLKWGLLPVWLPLYLVTWAPYLTSRRLWRHHIGPVHEFSVVKPISRRRGPRRVISSEALNAVALSTQSEPPKGFWKLPFEIRMMIWKELLLLEWEGFIEVHLRSNKQNSVNLFSHDVVRSLDPTLLRVSKRFYLEGMNILYCQNEFRIRNEATLSSFARRVAPSRLAQITDLRFAVHHRPYREGRHRRNLTFNSQVWKEACQDLQLFTQLRHLKITLSIEISGAIWVRCHADPAWGQKLFELIMEPLTNVKVVDGGEFIVGYTWPKGLCDEWPRGSFEMKHLGEAYCYWW